jgi:hypothetical protein
VGYYPLPPLLARPAARLDPMHAAFIVAFFRPVAHGHLVLYASQEEEGVSRIA